MNVTVDYQDAFNAGDNRHAADILRSLGITWKRSEGVMHINSFRFFDCENIPAELPKYVTASKEDSI